LERVRDELNKIQASENRHLGLIELSESKLLEYILPEIERMKGVPQPEQYHHEGDCFTHTYLALKSLPRSASLRLAWAVLLHDIAKPLTIGKTADRITFNDHAAKSAELARGILRRLKFPKLEIDEIAWLVHYHMSVTQFDQMKPAKRVAFLTDAKFDDLMSLVEADSKGTYPVNLEMVANHILPPGFHRILFYP
jgi:poly(A) polymerase